MRNSRNNASLALVTKIKNKNRKYNLRWQGNGFPSGHYHRGGDMRAGGQGCSTGCPLRTAKGLRVQAWLLLWLRPPVVTGVKATELLIFPKIFSKQQQPQQFSFQTGTFCRLFGHTVLSVRAAILLLLCAESGVELVVGQPGVLESFTRTYSPTLLLNQKLGDELPALL